MHRLPLVLHILVVLLTLNAAKAEDLAVVTSKADRYFSQGKYKDAQLEYLKAARVSPNNPTILYNLGLTDFKLRNLDAALMLFNGAIGQDPKNGWYFNARGSTYTAKRNLAAALGDFDSAVAIESGNATFLENQKTTWAALQEEWRYRDQMASRSSNDRYVVVSVSAEPNGLIGHFNAYDYASYSVASDSALGRCAHFSSNRASCTLLGSARNQCAAVGMGLGVKHFFFGQGGSEAAAAENATALCRQESNDCKIGFSRCSFAFVPPPVPLAAPSAVAVVPARVARPQPKIIVVRRSMPQPPLMTTCTTMRGLAGMSTTNCF
ncbi:tetratricopeptide (TPR) repeat protein [Bradyrhizobium sp. LB12.1]|uniref:tetratricopeptide repeat protein n=1 Tax=Bradyrhizobium sp. LB12.1 TaxID=3156327 RepID=UPI0033934998